MPRRGRSVSTPKHGGVTGIEPIDDIAKAVGKSGTAFHRRVDGLLKSMKMEEQTRNANMQRKMVALVSALDGEKARYRVLPKPHRVADVVAVLANLLTLGAMIPAILQLLENKSACDVSWLFLAFYFAVQFMWAFYAYMYGLTVTIVGSLVGAALVGCMCYLKLHYDGLNGDKCEARQQAVAAYVTPAHAP